MSTIKVNTLTTLNGLGNITVSRPLSGSGASLTDLPAANLTGTLPALDGSNLTGVAPTQATIEALGIELPAANLTGTVPTARLGSGTASSSTFLRGDSTYAVAGGGAWEHILTTDASNVANVDFDSATATYTMSDYSCIVFILKHVYGNTSSQKVQFEMSTDDGAGYLNDYAGGEHQFDVDALEELGGNVAGTSVVELTDSLNSGAGTTNYAFSGTLWFPSHQGTATRNQGARWEGQYADTGGDTKQIHGFSFSASTIDSGGIDAWRFFMSSGNISGRISMYGIKDS